MGDAQDPGFDELGFAKVDHDRERRQGMPEVIYGEGKSAEQIAAIAQALRSRGQIALTTRVDAAKAAAVQALLPGTGYDPISRCLFTPDPLPEPHPDTPMTLVVCAGTSDLSVAREAHLTLRAFRQRTGLLSDVGVAGIHRLLAHRGTLATADTLIVVAGMEGALPSVIAGMVHQPVIAVPTSVGYGAALNGLAALAGMLTSCASGITVVNIDNGFGAAAAAMRINRALTGYRPDS